MKHPLIGVHTMLRNSQELQSYAIAATDGEIGRVADIFIDDQSWVVRYLVVDTGSWLTRRKVLISPYAAQRADWDNKRLRVSLSREQITNSPDIDGPAPVSRQQEMSYVDDSGDPACWGAEGFSGDGVYRPGEPVCTDDAQVHAQSDRGRRQSNDQQLRSCGSVIGHHIHASDGEIGHVQSMLVDEKTWAIRYLVIDTGDLGMGQKVLIPPQWIKTVNSANASVSLKLTRETVKNSPRYESSEELNRTQKLGLYSHSDCATYWEREHARETAPADLMN